MNTTFGRTLGGVRLLVVGARAFDSTSNFPLKFPPLLPSSPPPPFPLLLLLVFRNHCASLFAHDAASAPEMQPR